jgi:hypothetical protein
MISEQSLDGWDNNPVKFRNAKYPQTKDDGVGNSKIQNKIVMQAVVLLWLADVHDPGLELIME